MSGIIDVTIVDEIFIIVGISIMKSCPVIYCIGLTVIDKTMDINIDRTVIDKI